MRTMSAAAFLLLCACSSSLRNGDDISNITLVVGRTPAAAGDSVVLTLSNGSATSIGYNLCSSALERQTVAGWEPVPSNRVCTMELRTLEAGAQAHFPTTLPANLGPDDYRYLTSIEFLGTGTRTAVRSNAFRVSS